MLEIKDILPIALDYSKKNNFPGLVFDKVTPSQAATPVCRFSPPWKAPDKSLNGLDPDLNRIGGDWGSGSKPKRVQNPHKSQ